MNATAKLNWEAIGAGAALNLVIGFGASRLMMLFGTPSAGQQMILLMLVIRGLGLIGDMAGGAVAGGMARRRGALHGLIAHAISIVLGFAFGLAWMTTRHPESLVYLRSVAYWASFVPWSLLGLGVAAAAGEVAARMRAGA